jgi:hypothetical protein
MLMSRTHQDRRRRGRPPQTGGFTDRGPGDLYRIFLPLRGAEKRAYLNQVSRWGVACSGLAGSILGYSALGGVGAVVGLGMGLVASARYVVKNRFHRG